jgi:inhibitor of KinA sporulation pathway (predicted exonuclease)
MYRLALDLELNKEGEQTTDIIQIGAVIGHIYTGEIKERLSYFIKASKPIVPFITELTGITQQIHDEEGIDIKEAYNELERYMKEYECSRSILTWGKGDQECLKRQAGREKGGKIGHRYTDVKTLYCEYMLSNNKPMKAGLVRACETMGITFYGQAHNAVWDANNTFLIYRKLLEKMKDN